MRCPSCGTDDLPGMYCQECGAKLVPPPVSAPPVGEVSDVSSTFTGPQVPSVRPNSQNPQGDVSDAIQAEPKNSAAGWALGFGIASVFLFEIWFPMVLAMAFGVVGLERASSLKRIRAKKTGFVLSLIGTILGGIFAFVSILLALGFGP